jgi:hypothetical protein
MFRISSVCQAAWKVQETPHRSAVATFMVLQPVKGSANSGKSQKLQASVSPSIFFSFFGMTGV